VQYPHTTAGNRGLFEAAVGFGAPLQTNSGSDSPGMCPAHHTRALELAYCPESEAIDVILSWSILLCFPPRKLAPALISFFLGLGLFDMLQGLSPIMSMSSPGIPEFTSPGLSGPRGDSMGMPRSASSRMSITKVAARDNRGMAMLPFPSPSSYRKDASSHHPNPGTYLENRGNDLLNLDVDSPKSGNTGRSRIDFTVVKRGD